MPDTTQHPTTVTVLYITTTYTVMPTVAQATGAHMMETVKVCRSKSARMHTFNVSCNNCNEVHLQ